MRADLARAKRLWVKGNPFYERVEGVVAGTPSLAVYDVILDAGASAKEDPAGAVPFDLRLPNGKTLRKPGNLFNLTEGMLWGTLPAYVGARADLDGDGRREFGEVLPEATPSRPRRTPSSSMPAGSTGQDVRGARRRPTRSPPSS